MPLRTFNPSEIAKLKQLMNEGIQVTGEVEALREGLKAVSYTHLRAHET